jgi:hypothetical protein
VLESQGLRKQEDSSSAGNSPWDITMISPWEVDCVACFVEVPKDEFDSIDSFVPDGVAF